MGADTFLLFKTKNRYENIGHIENGYVLYRVYNLKLMLIYSPCMYFNQLYSRH